MEFEVVLNDDIAGKLLPYQRPHVVKLIKSLINNRTAFDASDTGTGKTYTSTAACKQLGYKPFIVCPKAVVRSWQRVLKAFNCEYYGISNYELIQSLKYYPPGLEVEHIADTTFEEYEAKTVCDWIVKVTTINPAKQSGLDVSFKWLLPPDAVFIFDEAHKCRNYETNNAQLILGAKRSTHLNPIIVLSATLADKPKHFGIFGYLFGLSQNERKHTWIKKLAAQKGTTEFEALNQVMFPKYGARMSIKQLGDQFPQNQVIANCYNMENAAAIQQEYENIRVAVENIKRKLGTEDNLLVLMLRARQRIELLKVPTMVEMAVNHLEEGKSVVIFVCFTKTLETICSQLRTDCYILGGQSLFDREREIKRFQSDESRVIVVNIQAGGVGISLHDLNGNYPRVSIISPSWSATEIIQALGRIHRAGGKTPARQEIVFTAGTIEEVVCDRIGSKIQNIATLNDGDLDAYFIGGIHDKPAVAVSMDSLAVQAGKEKPKDPNNAEQQQEQEPELITNTVEETPLDVIKSKKGLDMRIQSLLQDARMRDAIKDAKENGHPDYQNHVVDDTSEDNSELSEFDPALPDNTEINIDALEVRKTTLTNSIIRSDRYKKIMRKKDLTPEQTEQIKILAEVVQQRIELDKQVLKLENDILHLLKQFN
jgi:superfamily II DNA or RNA helicase